MEERRQKILQELEEKGKVRVTDLSKSLHCSEVTIRSDIKAMQEEGLLKRIHGGAIRLESVLAKKYNVESIYRNADRKEDIARKAYEYIEDGDTIIIDDASTSFYLALHIKAHPEMARMTSEEFAARDIHIHVPEGATPKDGPSAGITMVSSMISALRGQAVKKGIAMTGEMTLRGRVLPVGGIKEKILAAKRAGVHTIIISEDNRKDIEDIKEIYVKGLDFIYVKTIDDVIAAMAETPNVMHQLHFPLQSGSDRILRAMRRSYRSERFLGILAKIREAMPDAQISTDIIVGFPGETYEDFLETVSLCEQVRYQCMFTFIYSPRPGTRAAKMPDPVPYKEKTRWLNELIAVQHRISEEDNRAAEGKVMRVLVEQPARQHEGWMSGRCENGMVITFPAKDVHPGDFVDVRVTKGLRSEYEGGLITQ